MGVFCTFERIHERQTYGFSLMGSLFPKRSGSSSGARETRCFADFFLFIFLILQLCFCIQHTPNITLEKS